MRALLALVSPSETKIGRDLDLIRQSIRHVQIDLYGNGGSAGESLQRRHQPVFGQDRWMDAAGELAQLVDSVGQTDCKGIELMGQFGRHISLCLAELKRQRYQSLLGTVVEVPLDTSARIISGRHNPRP